jgi:hypothetical protein
MSATFLRARKVLCALLAVSPLTWEKPVLAVDKVACVGAAEEGQRFRKEGHLVSARGQLLVCASLECPAVVSQDCTGWLGEVERSLASVTVQAHGAHGEALSDVRVLLDGAELSERAPTVKIDLDPGDHVFRCERTGYSPDEQRVHLAEGERGTAIDCRLTPTAPDLQGEPGKLQVDPRAFESVPPASTSRGGLPWLTWPLAGVGVVGIAGFAYFGLSAEADQNAAKSGPNHCAPYCGSSVVDPIRTKFLIADVSLGVGVAALGAAVLVALLGTGSHPAKSTSISRATP